MKPVRPYVPPDETLPEATLRAVLGGALFGVAFGAANAYLGLKVGLTVSTSIPIAVMSVAAFKILERFGRPTNVLECNISQTIGSASSSLASGVIFTIPALYMWGMAPSLSEIAVLAMLGGVLGTLFMIPLRPYLIVQEHAVLPYPEGTAAAKVLIAADRGGGQARLVFVGLALSAVYKAAVAFFKLWPGDVELRLPVLKKASVGMETMPALLGVGYILGYRVSAIMVAGGLLSSLALIPLIAQFGEGLAAPLFPETERTIAEMTTSQIWSRYVRYIGAGAVAFAGILTAVRALPTMVRSFRYGLRGFGAAVRQAAAGRARTERDLPMPFVAAGVLAVTAFVALAPHVLGMEAPLPLRMVGAVCVTCFAFFFVTVSSRIVGLVGVTSNPTSGMTIVTLLGTSLLFYLMGWTDTVGRATVLTIGTVVCVAASIAGDVSQDLKTGYLVGATPVRQQVLEVLGAVTSAFAVAAAVYVLGKAYTFGSAELAAPQATLMKTVIEGVLQAELPWGLVLSGAALALVAALLGIPALPFAVGIYLPVATMTPIFLGGLVRRAVEERSQREGRDASARTEKGVLLGSGLVAGEGLVGVGLAVYAYLSGARPRGLGFEVGGAWSAGVSLAAFLLLAAYLRRVSLREEGSSA